MDAKVSKVTIKANVVLLPQDKLNILRHTRSALIRKKKLIIKTYKKTKTASSLGKKKNKTVPVGPHGTPPYQSLSQKKKKN